jgi:chemotaxis protein CheX
MALVAVRAEHVNPFISSTMETFSKMVGTEAKPGKISLKKNAVLNYDVSGIIGLSGGARGVVSLSFPKASALKITNKFMGANHTDFNPETVDAIGELANIVAGNAKKGLTEFNIQISLPSVVMGLNHQIMEAKDVLTFVVPFTTEFGEFHMGVSLKSGT